MPYKGLLTAPRPDWKGLCDNLRRKGTPSRTYYMDFGYSGVVRDEVAQRFDVLKGLRKDDPDYERRKAIAIWRFSGYDYVPVNVPSAEQWQFKHATVDDNSSGKGEGGKRTFQDEHVGPIMNLEDFEKYPWPDLSAPGAVELMEWYDKNLPQDMCLVAANTCQFAETLTYLMGYETLCFALFENRDLVQAISDRLLEHYSRVMKLFLQFDRVKIIWASDDMGFKTGPMFSPADMRQFVLGSHKKMAATAHQAGRLYLLHSCGNLKDIIDDLTDDVKIDGKHSFEDTIEDVRQAKHTYGNKVALIGGIDMDFLCRSDEAAIRARVRDTLDVCMPGGGYCLGTGNSIPNYVPVDSYLAMLDEGRLYGR